MLFQPVNHFILFYFKLNSEDSGKKEDGSNDEREFGII